jgi:hypothetical protein
MPMNWLRGKRGTEEGEDARPAEPALPVQPAPVEGDPPAVWAEAACAASDKALAAHWSQHVEGDALLAGVATRCRFAEVRLAAAQRIKDPATLKRVADASREKDKHVYRHCTEALRETRQEGTRAVRAVELAAALRALLDVAPVALSHLLQIEKDLASLGKGGDETKECEALLDEARARVLLETQAQIDLRARLASAEGLVASIAASESPAAAEIEAWRAHQAAIAQDAAEGPAWLGKLPASRALTKALQDAESRLAGLVETIERASLHEAQRLVAEEARLAAEAEAAAKVAAEQALPVHKPSAAPRKKVDTDALQKLVGELEADLEEGRLAEAEAAIKAIDRMLGGATPPGQVARRLQRARSQEARLLGWARWGTDQAREQLIGAAEALLVGEPDVAERARAVPLLRREWKNLDAHGGAPQPLWKRFDRALERAYKPVAEQRAVEAAAHEAARAAKSALCDAWESWMAGAPVADIKAMEAKREEMAGQWRSAARAGFGDERKLRKRFDALVGKVDAQLEEARTRELARRKDLVAQAEALKDLPDLAAAMSAAKSLQRRWKDEMAPVGLRHGADHKVWQRFRAACDAVFARRDAEQEKAVAERAKRDEARKAEVSAAREAETKKREKHAARFAVMAEKAAVVPEAAPDLLARGLAERDVLLLDLEIALDLPTPAAQAVARRARMLARLQDRFSKGAAAPADPEVMVSKWYAIVATPDDAQAARMAAVVARLLEAPARGQARKDSRS